MTRSESSAPSSRAIRRGSIVKRFWSDTRGATAMEYGIIAALVSVAIIASVTQVGNGVNRLFNKVATAIPTGP